MCTEVPCGAPRLIAYWYILNTEHTEVLGGAPRLLSYTALIRNMHRSPLWSSSPASLPFQYILNMYCTQKSIAILFFSAYLIRIYTGALCAAPRLLPHCFSTYLMKNIYISTL